MLSKKKQLLNILEKKGNHNHYKKGRYAFTYIDY